MTEKEIAVQSQMPIEAWSPKEVMAQVNAIQELMKAGMTENEHWGKVPGCGDKPTLLKPGAEKLCLMFRLAPHFEIKQTDLGNGHREIVVTCTLNHINTGKFWGQGVGSCSTMESKYRYRTGVGENTLVKVPKEYWDKRRVDPKGAQEIIGGKGYTTKKGDDGLWWIYEKVDKVDNPDIADVYNTVLKIAKKRALVDATLTATAASDIFTQDIEEMGETVVTEKPIPQEARKVLVGAPEPKREEYINQEERLEIFRQAKEKGIHHLTLKKALKDDFGVKDTSKITKTQYPKIIEWVILHESAMVGQ